MWYMYHIGCGTLYLIVSSYCNTSSSKQGKDGQIFITSWKYVWDSNPVNSMTSSPYRLELHCNFGSLHKAILIRVHNLQIMYPHKNLVIPSNDIKSCFCLIKHNLDVVGAFLYILEEYLFHQVGQAFVTDFSPTNWEYI